METIELKDAFKNALVDNAAPGSYIGTDGTNLNKTTAEQLASVVGGLQKQIRSFYDAKQVVLFSIKPDGGEVLKLTAILCIETFKTNNAKSSVAYFSAINRTEGDAGTYIQYNRICGNVPDVVLKYKGGITEDLLIGAELPPFSTIRILNVNLNSTGKVVFKSQPLSDEYKEIALADS